MGVIDIICGIVLILASIMIIALVSMQESKRGMSALTGGQSEAVNRNYGRTRDALLVKGTKILTVVFFALTILVSTSLPLNLPPKLNGKKRTGFSCPFLSAQK